MVFERGRRLGVYVAGRNTPAPTARLEDVNCQYFFKMSNFHAEVGWVLSDNFRLKDVNHQYFLKCLILKVRDGF